MRIWPSLAAIVLAAPVLAQQGTIETQQLEPLFVPGPDQGNQPDNDQGGIVVRPVEPAPADGGAQTRRAPQSDDEGLLSEGFNDEAFIDDGGAPEGEGSFVDRAFNMPDDETTELPVEEEPIFETEPSIGRGNDAPAEDDGGFSTGWFTSDEAEEQALADDQPQFKEAPFTSRGLFGPSVPHSIPRIETVPAEGAKIRQLDKMTGSTRTVEIKSGQEMELGRLRVRLEGCQQPKDGGTHGTIAFLKVWDPNKEEKDPVFSGWMFAESPALSAMDHPRYDLWVLGCSSTEAADATDENPEDTETEQAQEEG